MAIAIGFAIVGIEVNVYIVSGSKNGMALVGWIAVCFSASAMGIFFPPGDWYAELNKPAWNPPSWLFGPVWTVLYLTMAVAAWRIWTRGGWSAQSRPLGLFLGQLGLNALWSPLFFGLHVPGLAFAEILCLLVMIVVTWRAFHVVDKWSAALLLPYIAWVSFASVLNATLWRLNA